MKPFHPVPGLARPAVGHMPFPGHRNQREVLAETERNCQIPWCPPQYREAYRQLRRKGWLTHEARPMIEEQIETDARRKEMREALSQ